MLGKVYAQFEGCNPIECFNVLDTLFDPSTAVERCQRIIKVEKCFRVCLPTLVDSYAMKGIQNVKKDLCGNEHTYNIANKCERKYKYCMYGCLYVNLNLEAVEKDVNQSLLMCRRSENGMSCDRESLGFCSDHGYRLAGIVFQSFFRPMHLNNCFFSIGEVYKLIPKADVKWLDYYELATCLDICSPFISDCVPQKWVATNTVIDTHVMNKLCRAGSVFFSCVREVVEKKCSESIIGDFLHIGQSLHKTFFPQCGIVFESEVSSPHAISVISNNSFNEVYDNLTTTQVSTELQKNSSTAVVHQHMVLNNKPFEINIAFVNRGIFILIPVLFCCHFLFVLGVV
ncbi:hypothetical protein NPIL_477781 [Nephila pilipes]|uniref:Uncharacterized protein n=1 Tax=Nephila pilipes TaxID=299642 RepID=A0A8X6PRZ3_NEPPI|nr:hypothetical protein NPIL_477781 [Nephila pilipes]